MSVIEKAVRMNLYVSTSKGLLSVQKLFSSKNKSMYDELCILETQLETELSTLPQVRRGQLNTYNKERDIKQLQLDVIKLWLNEYEHQQQTNADKIKLQNELNEMNKLILAKEAEELTKLSVDELKARQQQLLNTLNNK